MASRSSPLLSSNNDLNMMDMDEIDSLNNQIIKLQNWKNDVGIPAFEENEKLHQCIDDMKLQHSLDESQIYALQQENNALKIQLDAFHEEHDKWANERNELLNQLDEVSHERNASMIEEENWAQNIKQTYHKIDRLTKQHRRSSTDLLESKQTISGLLEENAALEAKNDEYKALNEKNETLLKETNIKLDGTQTGLSQVQKKYDNIILKYLSEKEKTQKILHDIVSNQLTEYQKLSNSVSQTSPNGAIPIAFNPQSSNSKQSSANRSPSLIIRRRSRSFDSDGGHEKLMIHHLEMHFDEKDTYTDGDMFDEHKIKEEIEEKDKELNILNDKYNELEVKYKRLKEILKSASQTSLFDDYDCGESKRSSKIYDVRFAKKQKQQFNEEKKVLCGIIPWFR